MTEREIEQIAQRVAELVLAELMYHANTFVFQLDLLLQKKICLLN